MIFNAHSELKGKHAFLSPSQYSWLNYDDDKLRERYYAQYAQSIGTLLHEFAAMHIQHGIKLNKSSKSEALLYLLSHGIPSNAVDIDFMFPNLMAYTNDAIGFRMIPEQILRYSDVCYGTADAISFREKDNFLRIHDYKSGLMPAKIDQLLIYEALFCLEYRFKPTDIHSELRIYQNDTVFVHNPEVNEIVPVIDKIVSHNKTLIRLDEQEG